MDKKSAPPIVPDRREMIGRKAQNNPNNKSKLDSEQTDSGTKNTPNQRIPSLIVITLMLVLSILVYGGYEYFLLAQKHDSLSSRFDDLESRLMSTDESVSQTGAAMQVKLSRHDDDLKKHWSEIRKLWGVSNDRNKTSIATNKKDISFLASQSNKSKSAVDVIRLNLESTEKKILENKNLYGQTESNIKELNKSLMALNDRLNQIKVLQRDFENSQNDISDAMRAIDSFRRTTTQKLYSLEQKLKALKENNKSATIQSQPQEKVE